MVCFIGIAPNVPAAVVWHWSNPYPHGNNIIDMACDTNSGITIEAGDRGQIYTSSDLNTWMAQVSHTTNSLQAITFLGSRLIVAGESGTIVYSDNDGDFYYTNLLTSDWLVGVAASPTLAVAVGDHAAIYTSANGSSWKRQSPPPGVGNNWLLSAAYGGGTFVAVGENGYIATSLDGTNWTARASGATVNLNRVAWISAQSSANGFPNNSFVVVGDGGKGLMSVNSGLTWTSLGGYGSTTNDLYAAVGDDTSRLLAGNTSVRLGRLRIRHSLVARANRRRLVRRARVDLLQRGELRRSLRDRRRCRHVRYGSQYQWSLQVGHAGLFEPRLALPGYRRGKSVCYGRRQRPDHDQR